MPQSIIYHPRQMLFSSLAYRPLDSADPFGVDVELGPLSCKAQALELPKCTVRSSGLQLIIRS